MASPGHAGVVQAVACRDSLPRRLALFALAETDAYRAVTERQEVGDSDSCSSRHPRSSCRAVSADPVSCSCWAPWLVLGGDRSDAPCGRGANVVQRGVGTFQPAHSKLCFQSPVRLAAALALSSPSHHPPIGCEMGPSWANRPSRRAQHVASGAAVPSSQPPLANKVQGTSILSWSSKRRGLTSIYPPPCPTSVLDELCPVDISLKSPRVQESSAWPAPEWLQPRNRSRTWSGAPTLATWTQLGSMTLLTWCKVGVCSTHTSPLSTRCANMAQSARAVTLPMHLSPQPPVTDHPHQALSSARLPTGFPGLSHSRPRSMTRTPLPQRRAASGPWQAIDNPRTHLAGDLQLSAHQTPARDRLPA